MLELMLWFCLICRFQCVHCIAASVLLVRRSGWTTNPSQTWTWVQWCGLSYPMLLRCPHQVRRPWRSATSTCWRTRSSPLMMRYVHILLRWCFFLSSWFEHHYLNYHYLWSSQMLFYNRVSVCFRARSLKPEVEDKLSSLRTSRHWNRNSSLPQGSWLVAAASSLFWYTISLLLQFTDWFIFCSSCVFLQCHKRQQSSSVITALSRLQI